jgi:hypothetical protein
MIEFAGVKRRIEFSPNHTGNDGAIFSLVETELKKLGCSVNEYTEDDLLAGKVNESFIYTMARSKEAVHKLQELEAEGRFVINSAFGIEQCYRTNMTLGIINADIPYPESRIVPTNAPADEAFEELGGKNFWIKRGDFHAIHKEDVTFVRNNNDGNEILAEYAVRGIEEAVISKHLYGDLVKFYGVRDSGFFYWFYPFDLNHSKFNNEAINSAAAYYEFDVELLKHYGESSAKALDVYIYGGDAIITPTGDMHIIDLNDWPSFAPCRNVAAEAIAQCIYKNAIEVQTNYLKKPTYDFNATGE